VYVAIYVFAIAFAIMFHEFGHFATARAFGMKCEKFFIGFGPTLWSFRRGDTEYGVKALPLGGFVKISGMSRYEDFDEADRGQLFFERPAWQRVIVLSAGSATHFVLAAALLFAGLAFIGLPTGEASNRVALVTEDSPAAAAGLQAEDVIVAIDGTPITGFEAVRERVEASPGEPLALTVERDGERVALEATPAEVSPDGEPVGFLGVAPREVLEPYGIGEALAATVSGDFSIPRITGLTLAGLGQVFTPDALGDFFASVGSDAPRTAADGGPTSLVGAGQATVSIARAGDVFGVLLLIASINVTLGTLNMLPLPPLDGGHIATLAVEESVNGVRRLRGKRERWHLDPAVVTPIALAVILFFGVISLTAIYADIANPVDFGL